MILITTKFKDLLIVKHKVYKDRRGSLRVTHNNKKIKTKFIYEYCTTSKKNSLRGFHFQLKFQQAKYVTVLKGKILDCVIDLRKNSKTFGKIFKIILSDKNNLGLIIPRGFAHAYYSFNKVNIIYYKLDNYFNQNYEYGINPLDQKLKIRWPSKKLILSIKDKKHSSLKNFIQKYKHL